MKYPLCKNGHEQSPENVVRKKDGGRYCRLCNRERKRGQRLARRKLPNPNAHHESKGMSPCSPSCPACLREAVEIERRLKTHGHLLKPDAKRSRMRDSLPGVGADGLLTPEAELELL